MSGRTVVKFLLILATAVVAVVALAAIALQTPWARDYLRQVAEQQGERFLRGDLEIGRLSGTLLFDATLDNVRVVQDGTQVVAIDRVRVEYSLIDLLGGPVDIHAIRLTRPVIRLDRGEAGWGVVGILAQPAAPKKPGAPRPYDIGEIAIVDGTVTIGQTGRQVGNFRVPERITDLEAELAIARAGGETAIRIEQLSFQGTSPQLAVQDVSGAVRIDGDDLVFDDVSVQLQDSAFTLDGRIENFRARPGSAEP